MIPGDFIDGTIKEIGDFLGGNFETSTEESKNSSEVSFHSSELSFHSSELLFPGSVGNFHLLAGDFPFPREKPQLAEVCR